MSTATVILIILVALGLAVYWRTVLLALVTGALALMLAGGVALSHLDEETCSAPTGPSPSAPRDVR